MCPDCGGDNLYYEAGMITGQKYTCKRCGYVGTFALERRVVVEEGERVREV
jgi:transposase-like protein